MTLEQFAEYLRTNDRYLIASHENPDADGLGAAYALALILRALGKTAEALVPDKLPLKWAFVDKRSLFSALSPGKDPLISPEGATLIIVDTHDQHYMGGIVENLQERVSALIMLDHHEIHGEIRSFDVLDPTASSTCELVCLLSSILGIVPPLDAAEALFAGMVYDTGSFAYPKTGRMTFICAARLIELGVKPYEIHRLMYESSSVGVLILQKEVLSSLELHADSRIAIQRMLKEDLAASGATYEDAEDLVNIPLQSLSVEVSVLFKENLEGRLRCSLRSKGGVNVAHIAQSFGGGGHRTAAGFTCPAPLDRIKADVLKTISKALSERSQS